MGLWNLREHLHSQDHGHPSLHNNGQVNNFVQDLHLLNLHGILDGFCTAETDETTTGM